MFPDFVWSLSNDVILSVSEDSTARLWDVAAGSCLRVIVDSVGAELLCCAFQPLNNNMFVASFHVLFNLEVNIFFLVSSYEHKFSFLLVINIMFCQ